MTCTCLTPNFKRYSACCGTADSVARQMYNATPNKEIAISVFQQGTLAVFLYHINN